MSGSGDNAPEGLDFPLTGKGELRAGLVQDFKGAMRQLASGVALIGATNLNSRSAITATAISSLTAEPPTMLACINRNSSIHALIHCSNRYTVNILDDSQRDIAELFGGMAVAKGEDRFDLAGTNWSTGSWLFLEEALAVIHCRLIRSIDVATHSVVIGEVVDVRYDVNRSPLVYSNRAFTRLIRID